MCVYIHYLIVRFRKISFSAVAVVVKGNSILLLEKKTAGKQLVKYPFFP